MRVKYFILLFFLTIFVSCSSEEGDVLNDQISAIENYLKSKDMEYHVVDGVFKSMLSATIIPPEPEPEPEPDPDPEIPDPEVPDGRVRRGRSEIVLQNGDKIYIYYIFQLFDNAPAGVYDTNISTVANAAGLNIEDLTPKEIIYGTTTLIQGLNSGLRDSKKGDIFSLFMTYEQGYGEKQNGVVPAKSALNIDIEVTDIIK